MKKYLMTGMAALAFCAAFTSCSKGEDLYDENTIIENGVEKIKADYAAAFIATFGQPASNQDWGFGSSYASTRKENKNLNEWGDPTKGNWIVPDALSDGQKIRVMAYFQANPGLTYQDPKLKNFFIQQVYKGGTTPGAISSEQYTQTNGTPLIGSNNMDWLYMGEGLDHVNDYNNGQWNNGTPYEVLNTGADANKHQGNTTHVEGVTHPDMITLMENSSTEFVAFGSSTGNQYHTDCCALAGWKVIEDWAIAHQDSLKAINKYGESLNDGWNRSFVGLDYENRTIDNLYSSWKGTAKAKDFIDGNSHWILYQGTVYAANDFADFDLIDTKGEKVRYVKDDVSNQAIADYIKYTKSDGTIGNVTKDAYNYKLSKQQFKDLYDVEISNQEDGIYNLDMILGYILQSALPTENNGNWVKNIGGRDYVFSDWIVTLTEAKKQGGTPTALRIIAEDLNATAQEGDIEDSDWDFNDVVFDVAFPADDKAEITLVAAGGTLPLIVGVLEPVNGQAYPENEVHRLFGVDVDYMVNTINKRTHPNLKGGAPVNAAPKIQFELAGVKAANGKTIPIHVEKVINGQKVWVELEAPEGRPAAKIGVKPKFNYCDERENIKTKYPLFYEWVSNPYVEWYKLD